MIWRFWSLLAGAPLGTLAAWAFAAPGAPLSALLLGALVGALVSGGAAQLLARRFADEPARGAHLASAASAGLAAVPACGCAALGFGPDPRVWVAVVAAMTLLAFARAARLHRPSGGLRRQLRVAAIWAGGGAVVCVGSALGLGAAAGVGPGLAALSTLRPPHVDARPVPACHGIASVEERLSRGAHPRLDPSGEALWFDADVDGWRQLQRLDLASGAVRCFTCGEPGDNARPWPGRDGVVFETSRHRSWQSPWNTDLYWLPTDRPGRSSQRLTFDPRPDDHALLSPDGARVLWSVRRGRGYEVRMARLRAAAPAGDGAAAGEGDAARLEQTVVVARGGARWLAPIGSSDTALVLAGGNPFSPRTAYGVTLADGALARLADDLAPDGVASADGVTALAVARRARIAGLLPPALASVLAPVAIRIETRGALLRETGVWIASDGGAPRKLEGAFAGWGTPTGLALSPDARTLYLAQRSPDGARERLLEIRRRCD